MVEWNDCHILFRPLHLSRLGGHRKDYSNAFRSLRTCESLGGAGG